MNSRFTYVDHNTELLTEYANGSSMYLYDRATCEKIALIPAGAYVHNEGHNANFFLPLLSEEELELYFDMNLRIISFRDLPTQDKYKLLEPIYTKAGLRMGYGDFPIVENSEELTKLIEYCIYKVSGKLPKTRVKRIGKYKISRR